jgi:hypothetical protein
MLVERVFGMLKGKFKILLKINKHFITSHAKLCHNLHMFAQHVHCKFKWLQHGLGFGGSKKHIYWNKYNIWELEKSWYFQNGWKKIKQMKSLQNPKMADGDDWNDMEAMEDIEYQNEDGNCVLVTMENIHTKRKF